MEVKYFSVKGNRDKNEDFVLSRIMGEESSVHIVADGMGGYEYGRVAAETVATILVEFLLENIDSSDKVHLIEEAVDKANNNIRKLVDKYNARMGTTIAGVLIVENNGYFFWVGDVKIICIRDFDLVFESEDHSLINEYKRRGIILEKYQADAIRHIVTRCIQGEGDTAHVDVNLLKLKRGDKIVICSDGVFENIDVNDLIKISASFNVDILKKEFENNMDNSSIMLIDI